MNIFADFNERIRKPSKRLDLKAKDGGSPRSVAHRASSRRAMPAHGDLATNAAMVLAKPTGQNPRALAERLAAALQCRSGRRRGRGGRPGLRQSPAWRPASGSAQLAGHARRGPRLWPLDARRRAARSMSNMSRPIRPGPMHVGHCRGAVVGDALANLLAFAGYEVTKEYYINDAGAQIDVLGALGACCATARRWARTIGEIPAGLYPGDYLVPVGAGARRRVRQRPAARCRRTRRWRSSRSARSTP